jgi:heme oxygenase (mycobilin-producing)
MIVALSRFKVANGLEESVAQAFVNRPRVVEDAPGFLGLEVFNDRADPSVFYLSTRWNSESAFRTWHASEAHHTSHRAMPKGLKLDAAFTQLLVLERLCE